MDICNKKGSGKCQQFGCFNDVKKFCRTHNSFYCYRCIVANHSCCEITETSNISNFETIFTTIQVLMDQVLMHSKVHWASENWKSNKIEIKFLKEELNMLKEAVDEATDNQNYLELDSLEKKLLIFKNQFDTSISIQRYLLENSYNQAIYSSPQDQTMHNYIENKLVKKFEEKQLLIQDLNHQEHKVKFEEKLKAETEKLSKKFKKKYKNKYEQKIDELKQQVKQAQAKNDEFEVEKSKIIEESKLEVTQLQSKIEETENESQRLKHLSIPSTFDIVIDKYDDQLVFFSKFKKLNFIKSLIVNNILPECKELKKVLKYNTSDKMSLLSLNANTSENLIDISYYIDSIKVACSRTLKEIYFKDFIIDSQQLSDIFRSSSQCENLSFDSCLIQIDAELDFKSDLKYRIKTIDFKGTGKENRSNWVKDRNPFLSIVQAMSNCALKSSLEDLFANDCGFNSDLEIKDILKVNGLDKAAKSASRQLLYEEVNDFLDKDDFLDNEDFYYSHSKYKNMKKVNRGISKW